MGTLKTPKRDRTRDYVFIRRARCPKCDSADLLTCRTDRNGDGSVTRWATCRVCGRKLLVVVE